MDEDTINIFYSLESLKEKIDFLNRVVFSNDNYDALEWLLNYSEDQDIEEDIENNYEYVETEDLLNFPERTVELFKRINGDSTYQIEREKDINVIIIKDKIYINYNNTQDLEDFKLRSLFNKEILFVENKTKPVPKYVEPYFNFKYSKTYDVLGILDNFICLS